ncbi:MAG: SU10 major capsid protein, partial [Candidatus Neomicrothrix subdominans]
MPGITGQGTTFNLPNYVGELFAVTPTDTPFLSAIGGLTGGEGVTSTLFPWQGYDLRPADKLRQRLEGANAQAAEERVRFNVTNVVEIHQETVEVSYTKLAATGQFNSTGSAHPGSVGV